MTRFCRILLASVVGIVLLTSKAGAQAPDFFVPAPKENQPPPDAEPLPSDILRIDDTEAKLKVIQRRSQLITARTRIFRTAIADPSIADVVQFSGTEVSVIGLSVGSTTLTFWFEGNPDPLVYLLEVIRDPSLEDRQRADYGKLEKRLALEFPNSKVYLVPFSYKVIVRGQAKDNEEAARILQIVRGEIINQNGSLLGPGASYSNLQGGVGDLANGNNLLGADFFSSFIVNMLEIPGEFQIALRVRIAELKREQLRRMGIDFGVAWKDGAQFIGSVMAGAGGSMTGIFEGGDVITTLNWLASNGTAKILAEPNITVLSGHTANFLSGGEFPVPTIVGIGGVGGQQTNFRGFGVSLSVTPEIVARDHIRMQITPEFSAINQANGANGIPGTNTRRITTTVEMREGQTVALAGLLDHQQGTEVTRMPFFGEIPYIGTLFNAKRATMDETELLILVSPELVRPMDADEVPPVPGHEMVHPNDVDLYWYNRTEGNPDQGVYQLPPYGHNGGVGQEVGYTQFNPAPWQPNYNPGQGTGAFSPAVMNGGTGQPANPQGQYTIPAAGGRYSQTPPTRSAQGQSLYPSRGGTVQPVQPRQPTPATQPSNTSRTGRDQAHGPRLNAPSGIQPTGYSNNGYSNNTGYSNTGRGPYR